MRKSWTLPYYALFKDLWACLGPSQYINFFKGGIQWSRISTRSDCEKAILDAWVVNSGLADCLKLLREVIAFRMRKKGLHADLMENFEEECVEFELNKKLAAFLSGS